MKKRLYGLAVIALICSTGAWASAHPHKEIRATVEAFLRTQTANFPGQVNLRISEPDARVALPACAKREAFLPAGSGLIGNTTVGLRCAGDHNSKTLFVPVRVTVNTGLVTAARALQAGQVLGPEDLTSQKGELNASSMLINVNQALGKTLKMNVAPGMVLRQEMLRAPWAVIQGQTVALKAEGTGFSIQSTGQALNNATAGDSVRVKTPSRRVISGQAQADGSVIVTQ